MRKLNYLFLLILVCGCATANMNKLNNLRNDKNENHNLTEIFNYSREDVFKASINAIQNNTKAIVHYSDLKKGEIYAQTSFGKAFQSAIFSFGTNPTGTGSNLGIFLEGDNPTQVRIAQLNYGRAEDDYKKIILQEIKSLLERKQIP